MIARTISLLLSGVLVIAISGCAAPDSGVATSESSLVVGAPAQAVRVLSRKRINQQDRPTRRQRDEQRRRDRLMGGALLRALPFRDDDVRIINGGLSHDGRRTVLLLDGPTRRQALAVLRAELRQRHDRARRYEARFTPLLAHLPLAALGSLFRDGGDTPGGRARVLIAGPTPQRALVNYRRVLRALHDPGSSYLPVYYAKP
jgi:hypothetical protein